MKKKLKIARLQKVLIIISFWKSTNNCNVTIQMILAWQKVKLNVVRYKLAIL